jgi:hypothetical protein
LGEGERSRTDMTGRGTETVMVILNIYTVNVKFTRQNCGNYFSHLAISRNRLIPSATNIVGVEWRGEGESQGRRVWNRIQTLKGR